MTQLSIRVPDEMKKELEEIAEKDSRSVSFIVKKAIEDYLNQQKEEEEKEEN